MTALTTLSRGYLPPVSFDRAFGRDALHEAATALAERGDWQPARALLRASEGDWALKDHQVQYLGDRTDGAAALEAWATAEPGDPDPLSVLALVEVVRAWEVRGNGSAQHVEQDAWPVFHAHLGQADRLTAKASALAPHDPTPLAVAIRTARGLQVSRGEFDHRWAALTAVDPLHLSGHRDALQYLCAKWYGSQEEMFAFARDAADRAPAGHSLVLLPLLAHQEQLLEDHTWIESPQIGIDMAAVRKRWRETTPLAHSRLSDDHSLLAAFLGMTHRHAQAAVHFRAMGRHASTLGWKYSLTPRFSFLRARAKALRAS
ncbi:hypothetical protein ACIA8O_31295 [Kitasatospora sp. NPDC051853]|uniref:hypothetical protein n=1 Tax=Kitasatospora sp. NPDC051853 TaxID=3364058 RepID=UPI00379C0468